MVTSIAPLNRNLEEMLNSITDHKLSSNKIEYKLICELAEISAGGDCPKSISEYRTEEFNIPIYSNGIVKEGLYGYAQDCIKTVQNRAVTIAARGTIGATFLRMEPFIPIIRLITVKPFDCGADVWLYQIIKRMRFEKNGSVQQQLTVPEVSQFKIPYPNKDSLNYFEETTTPIVQTIFALKNEVVRLQEYREGLLPLLMNGQVLVTPP